MTDNPCECRPNEAGDITCHKCGEYVNVRCWNCKTPRGDGECRTIKLRLMSESWTAARLARDTI